VALNDLGEETFVRPADLPQIKLFPIDDAAKRRELAERLAQERTASDLAAIRGPKLPTANRLMRGEKSARPAATPST
jgi:hypothetical protein